MLSTEVSKGLQSQTMIKQSWVRGFFNLSEEKMLYGAAFEQLQASQDSGDGDWLN